jgi:hypothetical protein
MKNLFAYTAPGSSYPEFISVNREPSGGLNIIVRSPSNADGTCGNTAFITLTPQQECDLTEALFNA